MWHPIQIQALVLRLSDTSGFQNVLENVWWRVMWWYLLRCSQLLMVLLVQEDFPFSFEMLLSSYEWRERRNREGVVWRDKGVCEGGEEGET